MWTSRYSYSSIDQHSYSKQWECMSGDYRLACTQDFKRFPQQQGLETIHCLVNPFARWYFYPEPWWVRQWKPCRREAWQMQAEMCIRVCLCTSVCESMSSSVALKPVVTYNSTERWSWLGRVTSDCFPLACLQPVDKSSRVDTFQATDMTFFFEVTALSCDL